jgi:hypothetical protein
MKQLKQLIFATFLGLSLLPFTGCMTAIGFGVGALSDSDKPKKLEIPLEQVFTISKNSKIQLLLKSGQELQGTFLTTTVQTVGDEQVASIVWYDDANYHQIATKIADIERIVVTPKRNGKAIGLGVGASLDVILTIVALKSLENSFDNLLDFGF